MVDNYDTFLYKYICIQVGYLVCIGACVIWMMMIIIKIMCFLTKKLTVKIHYWYYCIIYYHHTDNDYILSHYCDVVLQFFPVAA